MKRFFLLKTPAPALWGSIFAFRVMETLRNNVPAGWVVTYGELGRMAGYANAARAVGGVLRNNPYCVDYPCHRVVGANGALTGFMGKSQAVDLKRQWLEREGIRFTATGSVRKEYFLRMEESL